MATLATTAPDASITVMSPAPLYTSFPLNVVEKQVEPPFFTVRVLSSVLTSWTLISLTPFV
jgi:hypothetical protein